jgi:hypothetical protein
MDLPDLIRQVAASLHAHGTKALLLDDITRLRLHRADDQDTLDLIRAFMSMHVTLVLIGVDIPGSGLLREGRHDPRAGQMIFPAPLHARARRLEATQTERRFDLVELGRFRYDTGKQITAWISHLTGVEAQLRLLKAPEGMLTAGHMPEYLFERTDGVVGLLERLIEDGCQEAIASGAECLSEDLLDGIAITVDGTPSRDPGAGEVPDIPEPGNKTAARSRSAKRARSRNTVLDDHGPAASTGTLERPVMRPLPMSLEPITEESLVSYLLRLAYRLSVPPLHLARMAGLAGGPHHSHLDRKLLLDIAPPQAESFARLARLTTAEVTALTLSSWQDRYPPIARSMPGRGHSSWSDSWLFITSPRFCPSCLAGDRTAAWRLHGGPWRKIWHLPVVFACLEHQEFLLDACPHCRQSSPGPLIHRMNDNTLHPAQCRRPLAGLPAPVRRTPACGGRLDTPAAAQCDVTTRPAAALLDFQQSLLAQLTPSAPAREAREYFTDLRLIAALISTSWPHGRHLADAGSAEKIAAHIQDQRHQAAGVPRHRRIIDPLPRDPATCAALLAAARLLLDEDDLEDVLPQFARAASSTRPSRTPWARIFTRHQDTCSERLRAAAEPVTRNFRKTGGCRGTRAPLHDDYQPEHIAAFLQPDWYQRHLTRLPGMAPKIVRRTAAVRLVQWAMGRSQGDAAAYLGINPRQVQFKTASGTRQWAQARFQPADFDAALRELAAELRTPRQPLIDYLRRRQALQGWALDTGTWETLVSDLPPIPGPIHPVVNDRKRQDASIFVWTQVTCGEHLFAPRPIEAGQPPHIQQEWAQRRNTTWFQLARPDPLRHYADLRKTLTQYAAQLARDIDAGQPPAN